MKKPFDAETHHKITLPARADSIPRLINFVSSYAQDMAFKDKRIGEVALALEEALGNIIRFACPSGNEEITITCDAHEMGALVVDIVDSGAPFNMLVLSTFPETHNILRNLILLHGWATDGRIWDNQRAALEDRANVWAPDLPVWEAAWLVEKLQTFDPAQTVLVGWSLGGMLALEVCAAGFRPRTLITISTCASFCRRLDYGLGVLTAVVRGMRQRLRREPARRWCRNFIISFWPSGKDNGRKACRTCCPKTWIRNGWPRDWNICGVRTSGQCCLTWLPKIWLSCTVSVTGLPPRPRRIFSETSCRRRAWFFCLGPVTFRW